MARPGGAIENLTPWKPGQSGNPSGRAKGRRYPGDYLRSMLGDNLAAGELQAVARDKSAPVARRIAAKAILAALDDDGKLSGPALDRLLDRTEGRPGQSVTVTAEARPDPARVLAEARRSVLGYVEADVKALPGAGAEGGGDGD